MRAAVCIALAAIVVGAERPGLVQLAVWIACLVATLLVLVAVVGGSRG